jgi:hyperosmotically inducible periplasmic protein
MNSLKTSLIAASIAAVLMTGVLPLAAQATQETPQRTAGQTIDDASITASVKTKLLADERTKGFDINVDTVRGAVTLTGGADSAAAKQAATELARESSGVLSVDNRLVVAAPGTQARQAANTATASGEVRSTMTDTGEVIDDAWITTKVKSQLVADSDLPGSDISVETKNNVVHLRGVVSSTAIRAEAIRIAEATQGVRGVEADDLIVRGS